MAKIRLYTTERCGLCISAKRLLDSEGLPYEEINLARDADGRDELVRQTGMMTFPTILIGDEVIGGFGELLELHRADGLEPRAA